MTPEEFRAEIARLGLSQVEAARVLRLAPRSVRRYVASETADRAPIPWAVGELLRRMTPEEARGYLAETRAAS